MQELLEEIENYWDQRSSGYCESNLEELETFKKEAWLKLIQEQFPSVKDRKLRVLDIGTGPGFFAIIMAGAGHDVTAVDYTEAMLIKARTNARRYHCDIHFEKMEAHKLLFADNCFDLIVSRNLTWNLEEPEQAYQEWYRVLGKNGRLLNFDANWYLHVHNSEKRKEYENDRVMTRNKNLPDHYTNTDTRRMENIAKKLPLSKKLRPEWDVQELKKIGFKKIIIDKGIGERVWNTIEKINYASTPMFMIAAEK